MENANDLLHRGLDALHVAQDHHSTGKAIEKPDAHRSRLRGDIGRDNGGLLRRQREDADRLAMRHADAVVDIRRGRRDDVRQHDFLTVDRLLDDALKMLHAPPLVPNEADLEVRLGDPALDAV